MNHEMHPNTVTLLSRVAHTKASDGEIATMARETRLSPRLETIRERSDQVTRSKFLLRVIERLEAGEITESDLPAPPSTGPGVQLAWTLPEPIAARFPLPVKAKTTVESGKIYSSELRTRLINTALNELADEMEAGWHERVGIKRGWDGHRLQFTGVEAWTAGAGHVVTRGVLRRTGDYGPLEQRPLAVGKKAGNPAVASEIGGEYLWELLDITHTPEARTVAVFLAANAYDAVCAVRTGEYADVGLGKLDAQRHRPWRPNAVKKATET